MKLLKTRTHGAALVEYVILLALISITAIAAITTIGEEIQEDYRIISTTLSTDIPEFPVGTDGSSTSESGGASTPALITLTQDPSAPLPPNVTPETNGWTIDLTNNRDFIRNGIRFNADIFQDGSFSKRFSEWHDSTSSYQLNVSASWIIQGSPEMQFISAQDIEKSPAIYVDASRSLTNRFVPEDAIGIRIYRFLSCNVGASCTPETFRFNIEYLNAPPGWNY
jgi:Flp pilus assembly pilin Flp